MADAPATPLIETIQDLLGPNGCPWDKEQTPQSLCEYLIEECFELVEAVRAEDTEETEEELGDVFFLLYFMALLFEQRGAFTLKDIFQTNATKMRSRHPHVFGDTTLENREDLFATWEKIKRREQAKKAQKTQGVLASIPATLPPLTKAYRLHSKAARSGFTWNSTQEVENQLQSEWREWQEAGHSKDHEALEEEFGDLLFTLVELGRRHGLKANAALHKANQKFVHRFEAMEKRAAAQGAHIADLAFETQEGLWNEVKHDPNHFSQEPS